MYTQKNYTCNGMGPYILNKYVNWLALNMIQCFNTRARVLKRARGVILSILFSTRCKVATLRFLNLVVRARDLLWVESWGSGKVQRKTSL